MAQYDLPNFITTMYLNVFQDKLLCKLEENEPEIATSQEDEVKFLFPYFAALFIKLPNEIKIDCKSIKSK